MLLGHKSNAGALTRPQVWSVNVFKLAKMFNPRSSAQKSRSSLQKHRKKKSAQELMPTPTPNVTNLCANCAHMQVKR